MTMTVRLIHGKTWPEIQDLARKRSEWRKFVVAFCSGLKSSQTDTKVEVLIPNVNDSIKKASIIGKVKGASLIPHDENVRMN